MNNKLLGAILIITSFILVLMIYTFDKQLNEHTTSLCSCQGGCPHEKKTSWQIYAGIFLTSAISALGIYLIFFEKSQKQIIQALEKQKLIKLHQEKFHILLMGLDPYEKKVIKAVKEQDGITQQTLRLRTDMHKSKLSLVLDNLEKKQLITKTPKGKTNQIHLKIAL